MNTLSPIPATASRLNPTTVYLQKRLKVSVPTGGKEDSRALVVSMEKNIEALGFSFSKRLARLLSKQDEAFLTSLYKELVPELKRQKGAHVAFRPMYPNFPEQVINMTDLELYWNAIYHYITLADPNEQEKEERLPLSEAEGSVIVIELGSQKDYESILTSLAGANASLSATDKEILTYLLRSLPNKAELLPAVIPQRETLALVAAVLFDSDPAADITKVAKTATDVLRVATQLSGGDISLAAKTKYAKFARPTRRSLLSALEACGRTLEEDMLRHKGKWIRLGEILNPGQYAKRFPRSAEAFRKLRNSEHIPTYASKTEAALAGEEGWKDAVELLSQRPGEFLRRLDHALRTYTSNATAVLKAFLAVADKCATPALISLHHHFSVRPEMADTRAVFPKGSTAKMKVIAGPEKKLPTALCEKAVAGIEDVLRARFAKLEPLGKVFIAPGLKNYPIPFAQRSASKTLRTLPRGSQAPIEGQGNTLRFFIHWKNTGEGYEGRVDIDLSAAFLSEEFTLTGQVAYYNLQEYGGHHSGDITNAPNGAAEFIDLNINKLLERGVRYVAATVTSYTSQPYRDLPECFCGWMLRDKTQQGEIFEARTVKTKADLTGDTRFAVPVLIDLKNRKAVWVDLGMKENPQFVNALDCNKRSLSLLCKTMVELNRPTLHTLLRLHAEARGEIVEIPKEADLCFDEEFAYEGDKISAEYLQ